MSDKPAHCKFMLVNVGSAMQHSVPATGLSEAVAAGLTRCLLPHERLLWAGQPKPSSFLIWADPAELILAMVWQTLAVIITLMGLTSGVPIIPLSGFLAIAAGIAVFWVRHTVNLKRWRALYFLVTDDRILIVSTWRGGQMATAHLVDVPEIKLSKGFNGRGTIRFDGVYDGGLSDPGFDPFTYSRYSRYREYPRIVFRYIDDATAVYDLVLGLQYHALHG